MKTLIEKLATGNADYELPVAEVSQKNIFIEAQTNQIVEGELIVKSKSLKDIKGIAYSSDSHLVLHNSQFLGRENIIKYEVNTDNIAPGDYILGKISIITNAGEFVVNFKITVAPEEILSTEGAITNLDEFTRLVQVSYEEALKMFMSKEFKYELIGNDTYAYNLYSQLMKNSNRQIAMEEFLVNMGLKEPVTISIIDDERKYMDLTESYGDVLKISKSGWGYVDIEVEVKGKILHNYKERITYDNFTGNLCEYQYLINAGRLHSGENNAEIILKTVNQTLTYKISVRNQAKDVSERIANKKDTVNCVNNYLKFRTGKINGARWMTETEKIVDARLNIDKDDIQALLIKTQLTILSGNDKLVNKYLIELSPKVAVKNSQCIEYYCYYLYLKTIYKKNSTFTDEVRREIKGYFDNGYDSWQLLWMIMYMDERYNQNPSLKYTLIKDQFNKGCISPIMFFEAAKVISEQPELLRVINRFEVQLLNFASKYHMINEKLIEQTVMLFEKEKEFDEVRFRILERIYERTGSETSLNGICTMLINADKTDTKYFKWYELGVKNELKITKLYEYYIYSIDVANYGKHAKLVPSAYKYFGYSTDTLAYNRSYLYENVVCNFEKSSETYAKFQNGMGQYATREIVNGHIDSHLATIYKSVLTDSFVISEMKSVLPDLLNTWQIKVENENISDVLVFHKELLEVQQVHLLNGEAYVQIYTRWPVILFMDKKGNRFANVKYTKRKMLEEVELTDEGDENKYTKLSKVENYLAKPSENKGIVFELREVVHMDGLTSAFKRYLIKGVVDYYYREFDGGDLDEFITELNMNELEKDSRDKVMNIMITRGMYRQVYPYVMEYGNTGMSDEQCARLCSGIIRENEFEADERILEISANLFRKKCYDRIILEFLARYFKGTIAEMYELYCAIVNMEMSNNSLVERILVQSIFEGQTDEILHEMFSKYITEASYSGVRKAYYTYVSYNYFIKNIDCADSAWEIMEQDISDGLDITVIAKIAYLAKLSEKDKVSGRQIDLAKQLMYQLAKLNIILEFYKKFNKWFRVPYNIVDKTVIDYRTNPRHKVYITYQITSASGQTKEKTEEMRSIYAGVFTKELVMFYGEEITYSIDEIAGTDSKETPKLTLRINQKDIYNDESRFGMLNSMMICKEVGRSQAARQLMESYELNKQASEKLFKVL